MNGKLTGVGIGPGAPELLTLAAVHAVCECDCILLPNESKEECYAYQIVQQVVPDIEKKEICPMPFPMTKDAEKLEQAQNACMEVIRKRIQAGQKLVFLTIGDPTIYSTYQSIHRRVTKEGMTALTISGVPSFCAVAARLGISLCDQGEQLHIIPATYDVEKTTVYDGTRVYMKSGRKLAELLSVLRKECVKREEKGETLKVYAVSNCGLPDERVMVGIGEIPDSLGYLTIVIVKVIKK